VYVYILGIFVQLYAYYFGEVIGIQIQGIGFACPNAAGVYYFATKQTA
jgi:hypothetical protein